MTLSRNQEERLREALGALVDATPPGVGFEDLLVGGSAFQPKRARWPNSHLAFGTAFVVVMLIGVVSLLLTRGNGETRGVLDEPIMAEATTVEFEDVENSVPDGFVSHPDDDWYSIPAGDFKAFVLIREGEPPHVYATSCDVLDAVELPDEWDASCLEMTVDEVRVRGVFGYNQVLAEGTYADETGSLWYTTDCPNADVLLSAESADALPNMESTSRDHVEVIAQASPDYRVIPRNGWVWERTADGGYRVLQVEDFMLERTIESPEQCPDVPAHATGYVPVAYRIAGAPTEELGRLPDGRGYQVAIEPGLAANRLEGVSAFIVLDVAETDLNGEDVGCEGPCALVLGTTRFIQGSGQPPSYDNGVYQASSGDWTMEILVYQHILDAWNGDVSELLLTNIDPVDVEGLPAFDLTSPLRWATDTEIPNQMEVSYTAFSVRRGCGELNVGCSPSQSVQVIPADRLYAPAPSWDDSRRVVIADLP